jgi:hypothetical protein
MVGSSRKSTRGRWSRAAMSSIFMRSPRESSRTMTLSFFSDVEEGDEFVEGGLELVLRQAVDGADEVKDSMAGRSHQSWFFWPSTRAKRRR